MADVNLAHEIESRLPGELVAFLKDAGEIAARLGGHLYLVGGVVRDLLLGRINLDLDLTVEGDAVRLAQRMGELTGGTVVSHTRFGTARLRWRGWSADFATARAETYARPGALPSVTPGNLQADLFRRDFTINAMAIALGQEEYGRLIDLYGGQPDLWAKLVRVLHERSFIDDATRIWRAIRYEQRLDFHIEPGTLALLERDLAMLDTVSGDRIRHELELVLKEAAPEKALRRAAGLGVLARLYPALTADDWLAAKFATARRRAGPQPPVALYLALLAYRLDSQALGQLGDYLNLPRALAEVLDQAETLKHRLDRLTLPLSPGAVYRLLSGFLPLALEAAAIAAEDATARQNIYSYLDRLRYIRPLLTGGDLIRLGVAAGPRVKELLARLREAQLDGRVTSRADAERLVKDWLTEHQP